MFYFRMLTSALVAVASTMCTAMVYRNTYVAFQNELAHRKRMLDIEEAEGLANVEAALNDVTVTIEKEDL